MSRKQSAAVVEPPAVRSQSPAKSSRTKAKPKQQPPYAVVVLNDEAHTFQYVIETFSKVFGYSREKSHQLALTIHHQGRGVVWSGAREVAELKRDQIRGAGPDHYATRKVAGPLGVSIEPLPG